MFSWYKNESTYLDSRALVVSAFRSASVGVVGSNNHLLPSHWRTKWHGIFEAPDADYSAYTWNISYYHSLSASACVYQPRQRHGISANDLQVLMVKYVQAMSL